MKFTITRINKQNKLMVSSKTAERFLERIAKDDAKLSVTNFRMSVPLMEADYQYYKGIKEWQHVYPAAEFNKDESGNLVFQKSNGLVMLHFINLMSDQEKDAVKKTVSLLPMTFAAFEGADGRSLIVLVSICNEEGKNPDKRSRRQLTLPVCLRTGKDTLPVAGTGSHQTRKTIIGIQLHAYAGCLSLL